MLWHLVHVIAVHSAFLLGLFCALTAILLSARQEGAIQSTFENFWVSADDYEKEAISYHIRFMTRVADLETQFLDKVFGRFLISSQSILVSILCSTVSVMSMHVVLKGSAFGGPAFLEWKAMARLWLQAGEMGIAFALIVSVCVAFLSIIVAVASIDLEKPSNLNVFGTIALVLSFAAAGIYLAYHPGRLTPFVSFGAYLKSSNMDLFFVWSLSALSDVLFIFATRALLKRVSAMRAIAPILLALASTLALAAFLASPLLLPQTRLASLGKRGAEVVYLAGASNLFDVTLALLFALLVAMLLIHRVVWPVLNSTLFRIQEIGTKGYRGVLMAIGLALLHWSGASISDSLKEILKELAKD